MGKKRRRNETDERDERPLDAYSFAQNNIDLRYVKPYVYQFGTNAKGRWIGRTLYDVYSTEFGAQPKEYYQKAIEEGRITVNNKQVSCDYQLKSGDHISHETHRHEPPVRGTRDIEVVADTTDLLVVNKPSTVPMHPCGGYRFNSLFHILDSERKLQGIEGERLHIVHRLDRLTSGLTLFAKNTDIASRFGDDLRAGSTAKTYLARVCGDFGDGLMSTEQWRRDDLDEDDALGWTVFNHSQEATTASLSSLVESVKHQGATVKVSQPITCISQVDGVYECYFAKQSHLLGSEEVSKSQEVETCQSHQKQEWKEATTLIKKLSFNGLTSLVEVKPLHGRTHQIRLHLQFLGHPIANDPCYGGTLHYGGNEGIADLSDPLAKEMFLAAEGKDDKESLLIRSCRFCQASSRPNNVSSGAAEEGSTTGDSNVKSPDADFDREDARNNKERHCSGIWLHAFRYEREDPASPNLDWSFQTSLPIWAQENFVEPEAQKAEEDPAG